MACDDPHAVRKPLLDVWLETGDNCCEYGDEWWTGIPLPGQATSFGPQEVGPIVTHTLPILGFESVKDVVPSPASSFSRESEEHFK